MKRFIYIFLLVSLMLCLFSCGSSEDNKHNHTITFDTLTDVTIPAQSVEHGKRAVSPSEPEREGYKFLGWYSENKKFSFTSAVKGDLTLTAKWEAVSYKIEYIGEFFGRGNNPAKYTIEDTVKLLPIEAEHYSFVGWYLDDKYTKPIEEIKSMTGDIKLFAKQEYTGFVYEKNESGYTLTKCVDTSVIAARIPEKFKGETVTAIGENAFEGCNSLLTAYIPSGVEFIGKNAFTGCNYLTSVNFAAFGEWTVMDNNATHKTVNVTSNTSDMAELLSGFLYGVYDLIFNK